MELNNQKTPAVETVEGVDELLTSLSDDELSSVAGGARPAVCYYTYRCDPI